MTKKIQVQAEVTHKKNVSSGIGKGFGIVIGAFLALLVIAVSCSILIKKGAEVASEEIGKAEKDYQENVVAPAEKSMNEAIQKITESQEDLVGKEVEKVNKEDLFKNSKVKNTQNGITLSLDDYSIEDKGDWAKITTIKVTILNEGSSELKPKINVRIWDDESTKEDTSSVKATLESDGWVDNGNYKVLDVPVSISFRNLELEKTLKLNLVDGLDWQSKTLAAVEYKFTFKK